MNSSDILLTAFRQILILPLTLASDGGGVISTSIQAEVDRLGPETGWSEIEDHLAYLGDASDPSAYAEFVYFHAYIQDFLYDPDDKTEGGKGKKRALRLFERKHPGDLVVEVNIDGWRLGQKGSVPVTLTLPIERIHLYLFELGVAILVVEVVTRESPTKNAPVVTEGKKEDVPLSLAHAQALQNALRRLYPPYFFDEAGKTYEAGKIPEYPARRIWNGAKDAEVWKPSQWREHVKKQRRNPIDPMWIAMLAPLTVEGTTQTDAPKWRQIIDERIPSMLFLGVRDASGVEDHDFARLCFQDDPGRGWAYARKFMRGYERKHFYDRHWHGTTGTRYIFSGSSMVMFGTGDPQQERRLFPLHTGRALPPALFPDGPADPIAIRRAAVAVASCFAGRGDERQR